MDKIAFNIMKQYVDTKTSEGPDLSAYATKNSPVLTGTPTAPTAEVGTNNTQIATTEFVNNIIKNKQFIITPQDCGAKGDGITDDTLAVQTAINTMISYNAQNKHNQITFQGVPNSSYLISDEIDIVFPETTFLCGQIDFQGASLIVEGGADLQYVIKYYNPAPAHNDVHSKSGICNLVIDGSFESAHTGVYIQNSTGCLFEKINIYNCRRGILMENSGESIIRDCTSRRKCSTNLEVQDENDLDLYNQLSSGSLRLQNVFTQEGRGEELVNGKINLLKTQCIGFEITCDDAFIENCIAIDHVIGIKISGGDNKINGCHPWNMGLNQLKSSCCFFTNGHNYFVNNTCDRFYIGVYCRFNSPNFFTNTLFTNQSLKSADNSSEPNYCWFIDPSYAKKTKGQIIYAENTKVNGNIKIWERNLYWCNLKDYKINDTGTTGYGLLEYRPSSIENGYLAKIQSVAGVISIDPDCKYDSYDFGENTQKVTGNGSTFGLLRANGCKFTSTKESNSIYHTFTEATTSPYKTVRLLIQSSHFVAGRQYMLCFKYNTTSTNVEVTFSSNNSNYGASSISKMRNVISLSQCADTNTFNTYYNIFTAVPGSFIGIGFTYNTYSQGDNFTIGDICLYDVTDVPRYFLESGSAYAKRLYNFYLSSGVNMDDIPVAQNSTVSFKSLEIPVNLDKSDNLTDDDNDYYDIGYDSCGRAKFSAKTTYQPSSGGVASNNYTNSALLSLNAQALTVDIMTANASSAPFATRTANTGTNYYTSKSNGSADHTLGTSFNKEDFPVRLIYYPRENDDDFILSSFRIGKNLGCDSPIVDDGELIPIYNQGQTYIIKKNISPGQTLPTVLMEVSSVENNLENVAPLNSPAFTGTPTAPTASTGTNTTQIATTAFVKNTIDNLGLSGAMHFRGIDTSGNVYSGSTIGTYAVNNGSTTNAVLGDVLLDDNEEFVWTGNNWKLLGPNVSFKIQQSAVLDPTASGTSTSFISSISQDTNGNITASKANLPAYPTKVSDLTNDSGFLTAHQDLSGKANLNSPAFTGTPTAPTATFGTNNNQIATTAFVQQAVRPTIMVTVSDMPSNASVAVTATLIGSDPEYSVTEILNSSGIASLGLDYLGEYSIIFNNLQVKGSPTINVTIPRVYTYGAYWSEMVTYTVLIDKTNSNTETACTYADDALGMTKGSSTWDDMPIFKQIRPCVFQSGQVNYYLNPDNWNEKYGTNELSVLTGEDGDVMIEFPKFAYKIKTVDNTITVSVSTDPTVIENDNDYTYDAFSRLEEGDLNFFYKGAFKGYVDRDGKLRSIVGTKPANNKNIGAFRTAAQANGAHYQQSTYAQLKALQCLYLIKYGDRNGQNAVGKGVVNASASYVSGYNTTDIANIETATSTLTSGMTFGTTANGTTHMRLFGIEDFWGCIWEWVDGLTTDSSRNIITSWNSFSNEGITAITVSAASGLTANSNGYIKDVAGNTDAGFMPVNFSGGSSSTYWADYGYLFASCVLVFGGGRNNGDQAGPFYLRAYYGASDTDANIGARLSYA